MTSSEKNLTKCKKLYEEDAHKWGEAYTSMLSYFASTCVKRDDLKTGLNKPVLCFYIHPYSYQSKSFFSILDHPIFIRKEESQIHKKKQT